MRRPVWGGPQAAGKRHSQPFRAKRLPHPRVVCQPTKPVVLLNRSLNPAAALAARASRCCSCLYQSWRTQQTFGSMGIIKDDP